MAYEQPAIHVPVLIRLPVVGICHSGGSGKSLSCRCKGTAVSFLRGKEQRDGDIMRRVDNIAALHGKIHGSAIPPKQAAAALSVKNPR